jgi:Family of unknown function (DUF6188)
MKLRQKGRYLQLPVVGVTIKKILFDGMLTIFLDDPEESFFQFHSILKVAEYNQTRDIDPRSKDGLILFHGLLGQKIKEAKTDGHGSLILAFANDVEIVVEDGPYENWHYIRKSLISPTDSLYVHGGVGRTIY